MKEWAFKNGVYVFSEPYCQNFPCFHVYLEDKFLGKICPADEEDANKIVALLDGGEDPISAHWEDGLGHLCTEDGWGDEAS